MTKNEFLEQLENGKVGTDQQIKDLEDSIADHEKQRQLIMDKLDNDRAIAEIVMNYPKRLNPDFEFQTLPEFEKAVTKKEAIKLAENEFGTELKIKGLDKTIAAKQKELERLKGDDNE